MNKRLGEPKPILKWAGGKRQLLGEIAKRIPNGFNRYIEPFFGGGSVYFGLCPEKALLSDVNGDLILVYTQIRDHWKEVSKELKGLPFGEKEFYEIRARDREEGYSDIPPAQRAARLIYLNHTCYNGLYRVNSKGFFNSPYGRYKNPSLPSEELMEADSRALRKAVIKVSDFGKALSVAKKGDFAYLDPPYDKIGPQSFTQYSRGGFSREDQRRLAEDLRMLDRKGVKWLLSNSATDFIKELYGDFKVEVVWARRSVGASAKERHPVQEVLIRNY